MNKKIIIASASLGLLLIIYLGFTIYFSSHYFWNTIIGSVECGGKTSSYVIEQNEALADGYSLNITDCEGNIFTVNALGMTNTTVNKNGKAIGPSRDASNSSISKLILFKTI